MRGRLLHDVRSLAAPAAAPRGEADTSVATTQGCEVSYRAHRLRVIAGASIITLGASASLMLASRPAAEASASCSGISVSPGANLASVVNHASGAKTFCLRAGTYHATSTIQLSGGDR